jgi:serine/threonine-protein kinase
VSSRDPDRDGLESTTLQGGGPAGPLAFPGEGKPRYEQRGVLGRGGFGEVNLVRDARIGREVALKVLRADRGSGTARGRFIREACVQGLLEHPTIVPVYDLDRGADGAVFFTMKRVAGRTLADVLKRLRDGDPDTAAHFTRARLLHVFASVCQGVAYAHRRGIVHRDLKPANVMLGELGEVYVMDWGLAKLGASEGAGAVEDSAETGEGQILGTPGYMAPEQFVDAGSADARADVYSLGAILFEILCGEPLHRGETATALARSTHLGAEARASVRCPDREVPPELEAICVPATAIMPEERLGSVAELLGTVERYLDGDRDAELRRGMAKKHVALAREAAERKVALQEAGRALALDPGSKEASELLLSLLVEPPRELPPPVVAALDRERDDEAHFILGIGVAAYSGFLALCSISLMLGITSWAAFAALTFPLALAVALCVLLRRGRPTLWKVLCIVGASFTAIAVSSMLMGPAMLVPGFAAANTVALTVKMVRPVRVLILAAGCASIIVPVVLSALGVLPDFYAFEDGQMTVTSAMVRLRGGVNELALHVVSLATIIIPALVAWRMADRLDRALQQVHLQAWQLRQLAPESAVLARPE